MLNETTFDFDTTKFNDPELEAGTVRVYGLYDNYYALDQQLQSSDIDQGDNFGAGLSVHDFGVFVGAPKDDGNTASDGSTKIVNDGTVTCYDLTVNNQYAWNNLVTETALMDIDKLGKVFEFDNKSKQIRDHYDLYDPIKGRILGLADREIDIKTAWDPATYNVGTDANSKTPWADNHLGEVWWDLSTVKWLWYEQDTQEYKHNHWGQTFPGSSIDVYEWVESTLLPSEYVVSGNGTPLHSDDSRYTVTQKYNSKLNRSVNFYYYWVKGKTTLPANKNKKNTIVVLAWNFFKDIKKNNDNLSDNFINIKDLETNN